MVQMNDELENDVEQPLKEAGEHAGQFGKRQAGKAGKKLLKKSLQKGSTAATKAISKVALITLKGVLGMIMPFLPYIIGFFVLFFLSMFVYDQLVDSRPKNQELQTEETSQFNSYAEVPDEQGYYPVDSISDGNKLVKAFYTYFSDRSYWYVTDEDDDITKPKGADDPEVESKQIQDKYGREKLFYLSPNVLFALDEFLHDGEFRIPEQFIQPVPYEVDEDTGEMTLTDIFDGEKGKLNVKSTKYDSDGKPTDKKVAGVWDYGFAPVFHYKKYKEEMQYKGQVTQIEKWDKENQRKVWVSASGKEATQEETKVKSLGNVWMIDQLVSPGGTIRNDITHEWQDTGQAWLPDPNDYAFEQKVDIRVWDYVQATNDEGKKIYWGFEKETPHIRWETTEKTEIPIMTVVPRYEKQKRTFYKKVEGTRWEKIPEYKGDPDYSGVTGTKYYREYMESYQTYVPEDALTTFDIAKRLDTTDEKLEELLNVSNDDSGVSFGSVDVEGLNLGENAHNGNYMNALENLPLFEKYGKMYGVDPYLLVALTAQESSGSHYNRDGTVKDAANIGLMQVGKVNGVDYRETKTYNFETGKEETYRATYSQLRDIETNVKWGTMYLAYSIANYDYDVLSALQGYNFGTAFKGPWSQEQALAEQKRLAGNVARSDPNSKLGPYAHGDAYYVPRILSHYASPNTPVPYSVMKDGTIVTMDNSDLPMGTVDAINGSILSGQSAGDPWSRINSHMKLGWSKVAEGVKNTFGLQDKNVVQYHGINDNEPRMKIVKGQNPDQAWEITMSLLAYEEQKALREYQGFTEEDFIERFKLLFTNPLGGSTMSSTSGMSGVDPTKFFSDGFVAPVTNPKIATKFGFIDVDGKQVYHPAIDITVADGQDIMAVAKGTVIAVETKGTTQIVIEHTKGTTTVYKEVSDIKVKVGEQVRKGQVIAKGGGSKEKNGTFHFELRQHERTQDPTWIVDPSLLIGGEGQVVIDPNAKGVFQDPFAGKPFRLTSPYGMRVHPVLKTRRMHNGVDLVATAGAGAPVHAVKEGTVIVSTNHESYGNYVVIDHGIVPEVDTNTRVFTLYAHLQNNSVKVHKGHTVKKGQVIGGMGTTGRSTGNHLHFELHFGSSWGTKRTVNPTTLFNF